MKQKLIALFILFTILFCSFDKKFNVGEIYSSKSGLFSVKIPKDLSFGLKIKEENNSLNMSDDFGNIYRIEYAQLPQSFLQSIEKKNTPEIDVLKYFSIGEFFEKTLLPFMPNAKIISSQSYKGKMGLHHLLLVFLPEGSSFTSNGKRSDIHRAIITLRIKDIIFMVHTQEKYQFSIAGEPEKKLKLKEIENEVFSRGIDLIETINLK